MPEIRYAERPSSESPAMPVKLEAVLSNLMSTAYKMLAEGQELSPVAFVGSLLKNELNALMLNMPDQAGKELSVDQIRDFCAEEQADFVILFTEGWALPAALTEEYDDILEKYGSIANSPYRLDTFVVSVETPAARWTGFAVLKPSKSGKGREPSAPLEMHYQGASRGGNGSLFSDFFAKMQTH